MRHLIAAAALVAAFASTGCTSPEPAPPAAPPASAEREAAGTLGTFTWGAAGFDTHSFFYDTGREVIVFDAQFTEPLAQELIAAIRKKTASPITWVVVTHPNPDKFNGASAFRALGAKVIASESTAKAIPEVHAYKKHFFVNMAKMFTEETYPKEAKVDVTFRGDHDLPLQGGARVHLHELRSAGVTTTQTVAHIPAIEALLVGDLVHHKAHAWLEGGIRGGKPSPDLAAWRSALDELVAYPKATVYGGRGEAAPVAAAVADEKAYLSAMEDLVTKYVRDLGPAKVELSGPKAGEHHKKIAAPAQAAFPGYALPYLIEYGVYGLAGAVAAR
jgi:glyoxylase-like metal-dependent hydrolase (beta-lactamase superfamily II)